MRLILFFFALLFSSSTYSQTLSLQFVAGGFNLPVDITHADDERLFIVEKRGIIKIIDGTGTVLSQEFLDIDSKVNSGANERGLLGLAFHPNYQSNGHFFVNYTNNSGATTISRFTVSADPNIANIDSEKIILTISQPFNNHNGGDLNFGPDGYLYIGMGDGGSGGDPGNRSQNYQDMLGKMLRIDIDNGDPYTIPDSNPYAFDDFALDEIWAIGLRNPWRFSFDRETGDMWIGDVGQNTWEEIDYQSASSKGGENYGWRCYEAEQQFNTSECDINGEFVFPVYFYANDGSTSGCSVTGGYIYRGSDYPHLYGKYIFADYCSGWFWITENDGCGNWVTIEDLKGSPFQYSSFGEDSQGEIYVATLGQGTISKIRTVCTLFVSADIQNETCSNTGDGSISLNVSSGQNPVIEWEGGSSSEQLFDLSSGNYSVTVTDDSGCSFTHCFLVSSIEETPSCMDTDIPDVIACPGESVSIFACEAPFGFAYNWLKDGEILVGEVNQQLTVTVEGNYQVQLVGADCNYASSTPINISFFNVPTLTIDVNGTTLSTQAGFISYNWYLNGDLIQSGGSNVHFVDQSGDYTVQGTDANGCLSEVSESVNVQANSIEDLSYFSSIQIVPNPFSNNFVIDFELYKSADLIISVHDISGNIIEKVKSRSRISDEISFNTVQYLPGIYMVQIRSKDFSVFRKMVKY